MKGTDVRCPACGMINKSLFLEETEGMYECERCGQTGTVREYRRMPVQAVKTDARRKGPFRKRLRPLIV